MKKINLYIVLIACLIVFSIASFSEALEIVRDRLPNGLSIIHVKKPELPIVMVSLVIKASPLQEDAKMAGVAYMTAKMLSDGTKRRKATEISEQTDFVGASIGAGVSDDFTSVSLSILKKDAELGFDILSDMMLNPAFQQHELDRRKQQLAGALKKREEEPSYVADKAFMKNLFGDFSYGRPTEGSIESIALIKREDVVAFYKRYYQPQNAALIVVGDVSREELNALVKKYFSSWQGTTPIKPAQLNSTDIYKGRGEKFLVIDRDVEQANIVMGHAGIERANPDFYAVQVMNYILGGGGFASRLMKIVRDDMGLTYGISSHFTGSKYPGSFVVNVQTKNESAKQVIAEVRKQIDRIRKELIDDGELNDAKDYLTGSFPRRLETSRKTADFLSATEFYELGDDYTEKYKEYISRVTREDVLRVAAKYLKPDEQQIVIVGSKKKMGF